MTLIAIEEHWMMPDLRSALASMPIPDESLAFNAMGDHQERLEDLGAGRIATMDAQGIDMSILALTPPGTHPLPPKDAVRLSRAANDLAASTVRANPSRFRSMSTLPMASPPDVVEELERAAGMGHVGTMVYGRSGDRVLDDPAYEAQRTRLPTGRSRRHEPRLSPTTWRADRTESRQPVGSGPDLTAPCLANIRAASQGGGRG